MKNAFPCYLLMRRTWNVKEKKNNLFMYALFQIAYIERNIIKIWTKNPL